MILNVRYTYHTLVKTRFTEDNLSPQTVGLRLFAWLEELAEPYVSL